jgi:site-specific DNA recombinase
LEIDFGVRVVYVAQPTESTPAGRMQRRILANMASFYTEQQAIDVKEGQARRVKSGLFVGLAPYGYRNVRVDGRSIVQIHQIEAARVRRIFDLYAYHNQTLDSLNETLQKEAIPYTDALARFPRSKLHSILRDRSYIGEVFYRGQWSPGTHEPIIDFPTFDRVQVMLGEKIYRAHELTYAGEIVRCAHCDHPITGELKIKKSRRGAKTYVYYRCARYNTPGHPRVRLTESQLDDQMLALFDSLKIKDESLRNWFGKVLRAKREDSQRDMTQRRQELARQLSHGNTARAVVGTSFG